MGFLWMNLKSVKSIRLGLVTSSAGIWVPSGESDELFAVDFWISNQRNDHFLALFYLRKYFTKTGSERVKVVKRGTCFSDKLILLLGRSLEWHDICKKRVSSCIRLLYLKWTYLGSFMNWNNFFFKSESSFLCLFFKLKKMIFHYLLF